MGCAVASGGPLTEPQAKASLLFNLAAFVEWPAAALAADTPLHICVSGDADVLAALKPFDGKPIDGHVLASRAVADDEDAAGCHILFVGGSRDPGVALVRRVADRPVMTVGDGDRFVREGGALRIFFEQSRLRFEINTTNVARARLKISSKMLGLARLVKGNDEL